MSTSKKLLLQSNVTWTLVYKESEEFPKDSPAFHWIESALKLEDIPGEEGQVSLVLTREVDLETTYRRLGQKLSILKYMLICTDADSVDTTFELFVNIVPVNEYKPKFVRAPFQITLPENAPYDSTVMDLRQNASDRDVATASESDIHEFNMTPILQEGQTERIANFFQMEDKQKGIITVGKDLDFEAFPDADQAYVVYKLTVYDLGRRNSTTTLTIYITDVDDEPPQFFYPGCEEDPCDVLYDCEVPYDYKGPITTMNPAPIEAKDGDHLDNKVKYRIRTGPQRPKFRKFVSMDERTGEITVDQPLGAYAKTEIVLVIQAVEVSNAKRSSDTSLVIKIKYPSDYVFPNQETTLGPFGPSDAHTKDTSKTVVVAAVGLGSFIFVAFIGIGVLIVYLKKRGEKPIYPLSEEGDDDDEENANDTETEQNDTARKLQRGTSNSDSGRGSAESSARSQVRGGTSAGGVTGGGQQQAQKGRVGAAGGAGGAGGTKKMVRAKKGPPSAKGARRTGSARSDMSQGKVSRISIGDINPQDDPEQVMMYQQQMEMAAMEGMEGMYMDENGMFVDENGMCVDGAMAMAQMNFGNDVLMEEDETGFAHGGAEGYDPQMMLQMQQQMQRRPRPPKSAPPGKKGRGIKTPKRPQSGVGKRSEQPSNDDNEEDEF
ncbi:uncharacterized protein LOC143279582 [Babylonia areolata]|uniref:uncharacterized protein LOC143279582 n=1 Tax=Babylonia areolata TaxID=304850 RepID=UPI003FD3D80A